MTYEGAKLRVKPVCRARWRRLPVRELSWLVDSPVGALLDARGLPRPQITMPDYHRGRRPGNWGRRFPASPPTSEEVEVLIAGCSKGAITGRRNRALIRLLHRSGLRISEALALIAQDLDPDQGTILVRRGKGDKMRLVGMDRGAWEDIEPWAVEHRGRFGAGVPVFCVATGPTRGRVLSATYVRSLLARLTREAGIEKRIAPHQLRHALACELAREGQPIHLVSRQLGHSNLATTATYLAGIAPVELINAMLEREVAS